ncbi:MAG: GldG family protein [Candidatus Omnitrophica bacterium]|nr:GldG family protein [Candidatus Omnitrophota bacterium]
MGINRVFSKQIFLLLGLMFLFIACGLYVITRGCAFLFYVLFLCGLILFVVGMIRSSMGRSKRISMALVKKCVHIFFLIVATLFVMIGLNYWAQKNDIRWDVTKLKQHTLTRQTVQVLDSLDKDVNITVILKGIPPKYIEDFLREYARLSNGRIHFDIIDPLVDLGHVAQFGQIIDSNQKRIIVQSGQEKQEFDFTREALDEEVVSNAIVRVTRPVRQVYFLTGHGERPLLKEKESGLSIFASLLVANNFMVKEIVIGSRDQLPKDCDLLVVAGPTDDLSADETATIKKYLRAGGDALLLVEHTVITTQDKPLTEEEKRKNPSLNEIIQDWGLIVLRDIVVDTVSHASGDVGSPATRNYMSHRAIVDQLDYTFYIRPRSIKILEDRRPNVKIAPLVLTASSENLSWGETDRMLRIKYDKGIDFPGPVPFSFVAWEPKSAEKHSDTRLIIMTDVDFISNAYIGHYSNAEMGLNMVRWLSELDYKLFLPEKSLMKVEQLYLTSLQKRVVLMCLMLVPFAIIVFGLMQGTHYHK